MISMLTLQRSAALFDALRRGLTVDGLLDPQRPIRGKIPGLP
jgi:hypothetical protein